MVKNFPLFLGLSHIGQVFSIGWSKKIGKCAVFDFNTDSLKNYKNQNFSNEERNLKYINLKKKNIEICNDLNDIKNFKSIFFTYDTPIDLNGKPNIGFIEKKLRKLLTIKFTNKTTIFFTSQVYPGFTNYIKKKYLKKNKNIRLVYMVDTLKMGSALNRFLNPEQLIFGCDKKDEKIILRLFKKFNCKKFIRSSDEAELLKVSINLFLYFSVNFSNILNNFSKQIGCDYTNILENLKNDKRIGLYSYINPSPSISGGHLERDAYFFQKLSKNYLSKKILKNFNDFNNNMKINLKNFIKKLTKKKRIKVLIIGISYKENSFSLVNSIYKEIIKCKNMDCYVYDSYFKKIKMLKVKEFNNIIDALNSVDVVLYNYSNASDVLKIKKNFLKKNNKKILINLSSSNKKFLNLKKTINFYSKDKIQ